MTLLGIKRRQLKLFEAILAGDWAEVVFRSNSKEARQYHGVVYDERPEKVRLLPLHLACLYNPPLEVVESLVAAYPEALRDRDTTFRRTPLHFALLKCASAEVVAFLIKSDLDRVAARSKDRVGRLPLHYAMCSHSSLGTVEMLCNAFPLAAREQDVNGWLPFHVGCAYGMSQDLFLYLYKIYPDALYTTTTRGDLTPLQCAQRNGRTRECQMLVSLQNNV